MKSKRQARRRRLGMTLMEVLLVLVILVIIGSGVGLAINTALKSAKINAAKAQVQNFKEGVKMYFTLMQYYPEALVELVEEPSDADGWQPCLEKTEIPLDPWGNEYQFELLDDSESFRIWSMGPDMTEGTDDDVILENN